MSRARCSAAQSFASLLPEAGSSRESRGGTMGLGRLQGDGHPLGWAGPPALLWQVNPQPFLGDAQSVWVPGPTGHSGMHRLGFACFLSEAINDSLAGAPLLQGSTRALPLVYGGEDALMTCGCSSHGRALLSSP